MMMSLIKLPLLYFLLGHVASSIETGTPHSSVQTLTKDNVDDALQDPANGLWLLKFYAPWCGHCKKLAPTLDKMAPYLAGKLAIGKIDCTDSISKPICDDHLIKGYPTLKIFRDGEFFEYPGKRDPDSMISFAEKMSSPAVKVIGSYDEALEKVVNNDSSKGVGAGDGVAFVAYDGNAANVDVATLTLTSEDGVKALEEFMASSKGLQVFGQVARKLQAEAYFGVLHSGTTEHELDKFGITLTGRNMGPIFMKIEDNVPTALYDGPISSPEFIDFVRENNVALITELTGLNFRAMTKRGKPFAIAVVDDEDTDKTDAYMQLAREYAQNGSERSKYIFCRMDARKWNKFLDQFPIDFDSLPTFLVLDSPKKQFWHNHTVASGIADTLDAIKGGKIEMKKIEPKRPQGFVAILSKLVIDHLTVVVLLLGLAVCFMIYLSIVTSGEVHEQAEMERKKKN